jgi:hypothetical protein
MADEGGAASCSHDSDRGDNNMFAFAEAAEHPARLFCTGWFAEESAIDRDQCVCGDDHGARIDETRGFGFGAGEAAGYDLWIALGGYVLIHVYGADLERKAEPGEKLAASR